MIDYGLIQFGAAPRVGSTWFRSAVHGLIGDGGVHHPFHPPRQVHGYFEELSTVPRVTIVRHPCDWMESYFLRFFTGRSGTMYPLGVLSDRLSEIIGVINTFSEFIEHVIVNEPGIVGRVFAAYKADIRLRTDRLAYDTYRLLCNLGCARQAAKGVFERTPENARDPHRSPEWDPQLRQRFLDSEQECLEQFGFC